MRMTTPTEYLPLTYCGAGNRTRTISRIRRILLEEWQRFGFQIVQGKRVISRGHRETEGRYTKRIGTYWRESTGHGFDGNDRQELWSSAFICWVMQEAGVRESEFPMTRRHSKYIYESLQNTHKGHRAALFQGRRLNEYQPKVGDLVAYAISDWMSGYDKARNHWKYRAHGDIVVHTQPGRIFAIGGNVRDSVSLSMFRTTRDGYLDPKLNIQRFFVAIENNLPFD